VERLDLLAKDCQRFAEEGGMSGKAGEGYREQRVAPKLHRLKTVVCAADRDE